MKKVLFIVAFVLIVALLLIAVVIQKTESADETEEEPAAQTSAEGTYTYALSWCGENDYAHTFANSFI